MTSGIAVVRSLHDLQVSSSASVEAVPDVAEKGSAMCEDVAAHRPPCWGRSLSESDYATLAESWITRELADSAMLRRVDKYEGREIVGERGKRDCSGILISYYWPGEVSSFNHRIRRDNPEWTASADGKSKAERKYLASPGGGNRLFIPPGVTPEQLGDIQTPIALVEGEKKALALWRLANHETGKPHP